MNCSCCIEERSLRGEVIFMVYIPAVVVGLTVVDKCSHLSTTRSSITTSATSGCLVSMIVIEVTVTSVGLLFGGDTLTGLVGSCKPELS